MAMVKECSMCEKRKATRSQFRWLKDREDWHPWCRVCEAEARRSRR